jgi:hypothetical protein
MLENQRRARARNEKHAQAGSVPSGPILGLVCECGHDDCREALVMTSAEYARMRANPVAFAVTPEHVLPDVDVVLERHLRFTIVASPDA